jgi:hypothetical protein
MVVPPCVCGTRRAVKLAEDGEQVLPDRIVMGRLSAIAHVAGPEALQHVRQFIRMPQAPDDQNQRGQELLLLFFQRGSSEERLDGRVLLEQPLIKPGDQLVPLRGDQLETAL